MLLAGAKSPRASRYQPSRDPVAIACAGLDVRGVGTSRQTGKIVLTREGAAATPGGAPHGVAIASMMSRMSRYFCHDHPDVLSLETTIIDARPGAVVLAQSPYHPGGGGQLPDRGRLAWTHGESRITGFEIVDGVVWHLLADPVELSGEAMAWVDQEFRAAQTELHTDAHLLNALVYQQFNGALLTGAQLGDDGTARCDFDLPDVDGARLRALEGALNDAIRQDLPVRYAWVPREEAEAQPGLLRSRSVAPPPSPDGLLRIVEIVGLDRQACGGTHLASTGQSRPVRILKIDNKGRHNRRVKYGLVDR
jgi:misacylated tRNA(Ala) deacylase